jgi:hypothetical protein
VGDGKEGTREVGEDEDSTLPPIETLFLDDAVLAARVGDDEIPRRRDFGDSEGSDDGDTSPSLCSPTSPADNDKSDAVLESVEENEELETWKDVERTTVEDLNGSYSPRTQTEL